MKIINSRNVIFNLICLFFVCGCKFTNLIGKDSTTQSKIRFLTYIGVAKSNYFYSRAPNSVSDFKRGIDNSRPAYSVGVESMIKLPSHFYLGVGLNYSSVKLQAYYTNFVNTNLLSGYIGTQFRHDYISIPLNLYWKTPVSTKSSMYIFVGAESFKTTILKQNKKEYILAVRSNGTADNSANIQTQFKLENFSLFRIFNTGLRFEFNQEEKNRVAIGVNYYLMRNFFPIENQSLIFIGNKSYEANNHLYFEGLRFTIGYIW